MSPSSRDVISVDSLSKDTRAALTTVRSSPNVSRSSTKPVPPTVIMVGGCVQESIDMWLGLNDVFSTRSPSLICDR